MINILPLHERLAYRPVSRFAVVARHDCRAIVSTIVFPFQRCWLDMEVLAANLETDFGWSIAGVVTVQELAACGFRYGDVAIRSQYEGSWRILGERRMRIDCTYFRQLAFRPS